MKNMKPIVDYRKLRLSNITSPQYRHLLWLLFWPLFLVVFNVLELLVDVSRYPVYCALDDIVPFNEFFVIPYLLWYPILIGLQLYTLLYDVESFKRFMKYVTITYSVSVLIFIVFPNCQMLRPTEFARDNILVDVMKWVYSVDTNTNVFPSLHVVGSMAILTSAINTKKFQTPMWTVFFIITTVLISISTVFLKQHSVLDIVAALPICFMAYFPCYVALPKKSEKLKVKAE